MFGFSRTIFNEKLESISYNIVKLNAYFIVFKDLFSFNYWIETSLSFKPG